MYLVHQIIACILLYATLFDLNWDNWRQEQDIFIHGTLRDLTSALYHDDVVTKVGFDKRREDGLIHGRWLEGKCCILKGSHHGSANHPTQATASFGLVLRTFLGNFVESLPGLDSLERFRRFRVFLAEDVPHIDGRRSLQTALALSPLVFRLLALPFAFSTALLLSAFWHGCWSREEMRAQGCAGFGVLQQVPPRCWEGLQSLLRAHLSMI